MDIQLLANEAVEKTIHEYKIYGTIINKADLFKVLNDEVVDAKTIVDEYYLMFKQNRREEIRKEAVKYSKKTFKAIPLKSQRFAYGLQDARLVKAETNNFLIMTFWKSFYDKILLDPAKELGPVVDNGTIANQKSIQQKYSDKNFPAKYYALYHWILIEIGRENHFEKNEDDQYKKSEIEQFARERYPDSSPQSFYRAFINIDITKRAANATEFGTGYKEKIIQISNNDSIVISHLRNYPN